MSYFHFQMRGAGVGQAGAGAGHGGQGGVSKTKRDGGLYYDSVTQPSIPGSGAVNDVDVLKAHGGGILKFEVTTIMHVDGELVEFCLRYCRDCNDIKTLSFEIGKPLNIFFLPYMLYV